jgi:hypothetical protein
VEKRPEIAMSLAALLLAALLLPDLTRTVLPGITHRFPEAHAVPQYHGGKTYSPPSLETSCQSDKCHAEYPHKKDRTISVFCNMHQSFTDCLSCHGREAGKRLELKSIKEGKGWKISYAADVKEDPHAGLGSDRSCRKCHSEAGMRMLLALHIPELSRGFADPIALRMIEGGSRQWVPADLR